MRFLPHNKREGVAPVFPAIAGSAVAMGPRDDHLKLVIDGVPGTAMQAFGRQLGPAQLAAVVPLSTTRFGNDPATCRSLKMSLIYLTVSKE